MKIRDNKKIIIGLTGYSSSGSSSLAKMLAFNFEENLEKYFLSFNEARISECYRKLAALKEAGRERKEDLENELRSLKTLLEKREIIDVLERYKNELLGNKFFYISFSQMIVLFVIRYIKDCDDQSIINCIENELSNLGFTLNEAIDITSSFIVKSSNIRKPDIKERCIKLFSQFSKIRDRLIELKGRGILQDYGDNIRKYGNPFKTKSKDIRSLNGRWLAVAIDRYIQLLSLRYKYFVVESFRSPQELYYFREKYSFFYLVAISASREDRLRWSRLGPSDFERIEDREMKNEDIRSLNVSRCIDIADIVIFNDASIEDLFRKILRYTALILEPGSIKPSQNETLMHVAYSLSVRSNCLSRQVGAVITNADGYIIGAGWNDVGEGQLSCGEKKGKDYKEEYLYDGLLKITDNETNIYLCIKKKYEEAFGEKECPVLHAEENAILQLSMYGNGNSRGGIIYTTTYPCPQCLRKISQIGISKVVFVEEYPNRLRKFYTDQSIKNIIFEPFQGVKSNAYYKLFKPYYDKKEQQVLLNVQSSL